MGQGQITTNPGTVASLGRQCRPVAETDVKPGGSSLAEGWTPRSELACRSILITCRGAWQGTFSLLTSTWTSVGDKLVAVANETSSTDGGSADEFDHVRQRESVPGVSGGRHYA